MLKKITEDIYFLDHVRETDRPSLGLIVGEKRSMVVDSGNSPKHAEEFLQEAEKVTKGPIQYLGITHCHWDHIGGMGKMNIPSVGSRKTQNRLEEMKHWKWDDASLEKQKEDGVFNDFIINAVKGEMNEEERKDFRVSPMDIVFEGKLAFDLGNITCEMLEMDGPHTEDTTLIYVPERKVLFLGDSIYGSRKKGKFGYDREKLFSLVDVIRSLDVTYYVVSHESILDQKEMEDFFGELERASKAAGSETSVNEGKKQFTAMFNREPEGDELFYIECFCNWNEL